ncbi:hypothetical protein CISIN_1g025205mg [Citrus sinensis]|uniref:Uncharacterized protein n=1 Tax=Citrus sinensis TaxID=2711 RepID=A0A067F9M8_CITSI|nr:hypothetical protein CISIN_1g025205mg [Citrus sinensis]
MASDPSLQPEIGPDGLSREAPVIAYTERKIEEEQLQLRKFIEENYSKIRDVERELANLTMEMKLTAGPKKAALEHLRKKIEMSTERIRVAKQKEEQAQKVWEAASQAVKDEEAMKQKLCEDLNNLVKESSSTQFSRLEELKRRLEALNPSRASAPSPYLFEILDLDLSLGWQTDGTCTDQSSFRHSCPPTVRNGCWGGPKCYIQSRRRWKCSSYEWAQSTSYCRGRSKRKEENPLSGTREGSWHCAQG